MIVSFEGVAQQVPQRTAYENALSEISGMLTDSLPGSFKRAVFLVENSYLGNLSYEKYEQNIKFQGDLCKQIAAQSNLIYDGTDKAEVSKYAAVFRLMTDSIRFQLDSSRHFVTIPYTYDFNDFLGEGHWENMLVTKLLRTRSGNCHSMPFLYKILCEEIGAKAYLSMAPNHIYIKQRTKKSGWFNTELTSRYFPMDAWIMASGYISLTAVQNKIYMDTLGLKQSLAVCLIDLAKGYERVFPNEVEFVEKCAEIAIRYYPTYVNALILQAEMKKRRFEDRMISAGVSYAVDLFYDAKAKQEFEYMEKLYFDIHKLGYRMMPKEMYISWLAELSKEKEKYANKEIIGKLKSVDK